MRKQPIHTGQHNRIAVVTFTVGVLLLPTQIGRACTAFCQETDGVVLAAKNLDWYLDYGLLITNKRGILKRAMLMNPREKAAVWTSKYGSVTFNQYGRENPLGGMNEVGLVVESLNLSETQLPARDERSTVSFWIQYQLDNCRTLEEVIKSDKTIRIDPDFPVPSHYFVCDREGNTAIIEFLHGKFICHAGSDLPHKLITNHTCAASLGYLDGYLGFGGDREIPYRSQDSLDRFVIAAERLRTCDADSLEECVQYAFRTLVEVAQDEDIDTMWSIVYDLANLRIHYKTTRCTETRTVDVRTLDFSSRTPVQMININTPHVGLLNPHFADYDADLNRWLLFYTVRHTPGFKEMPEDTIDSLARYPETTFAK